MENRYGEKGRWETKKINIGNISFTLTLKDKCAILDLTLTLSSIFTN